jgi:hypothetical protein
MLRRAIAAIVLLLRSIFWAIVYAP